MSRFNHTALVEPKQRLYRLVTRFAQSLMQAEALGGVWLVAAAAVALVWANSPWAHNYEQILKYPVGFSVGPVAFERSLEWFINDGLMVLFFFVVGLEIRLEVHGGELAEWRRAALPILAAFGGMLAPAILYLAAAGSPATRAGWGIPTATDIAFAVGIIALLGKRVPRALRILLLALAIIDDIGAIVIIAVFYSNGLSLNGLAVASLGVVGILGLQALRVQRKWVYILPAGVIWVGTYRAGIHPTLTGVIVGLLTPVKDHGRTSPAKALLHRLHPWVTFGIMPVFALANAGVTLDQITIGPDSRSVVLGVCLGLLVGKPLGVISVTLVALKLGLVYLPRGLTMRHLVVLGCVAGIGFTMSLFVAQLAFTSDPPLLNASRLSIVVASATSAISSLGLGRWLLTPARAAEAPQSST